MTFCNPLSLPDYPVGRLCRDVVNGQSSENSTQWLLGRKQQYRELADPTVLLEEGNWYLYPSTDMAWVSDDNGATWQHHPLNIRDVGYAPTVVKHAGRFLLMASGSALYAADSPLGNYVQLGPIVLPADSKAPVQGDPMLFSDDDGRLYFYWGCSESSGIWGVELDRDNPTKVIGNPAKLIPFRPDIHHWERLGEWNQNPNVGWLEGAWMLKQGGKYYLTYSAAGTEFRTYAMGCYVGDSPLGPFTPQKRNPILRTTEGLVTGTGHGCIVPGPDGGLWAFYTIRAGVAHIFERRVGMDRAEIDANGELVVSGATQFPQWLPGKNPGANSANETGWLPLNGAGGTFGSTSAPNLPGLYAVDNELRTWWQPAEGDLQPVLTSSFTSPAVIHAVRIIWCDVGLNANKGVLPGPYRYRVEAEVSPDSWKTIIDRTASTEDLLVDYRECPPATASKARLIIMGWPKGITPGVVEFTVFGETVQTYKP